VYRLLLFSIVLGCTSPPSREAFVVKLAMWGPLGELAPTGNETALASIAQPWVYERLVTIDAAGELRPSLAATVDRLSNKELRVEVRRDATFSDGTPVTDVDVIQSLEPAGLRAIKSDGALLIESRQEGLPADALLLNALVFRRVQDKFLGTGPFAVASQTPTELRLARRIPAAGRINDVRIIAYDTPRDAFAHTLKGDTNLIVDVESRWLEFFKGVPSLQIIRGTGRSTDSILFNPELPRSERLQLERILGSQRVRDLAYDGGECAEGSGGDEPGPPAGRPLRVVSWGPFERLALASRRVLADRAGEVSQLVPEEAVSRVRNRDFDLVTARPLRWPPSALALVWRTGAPYNLIGYSNPAVDRAVDAGDWRAAHAALREDPPGAFVCTREQIAVVDVRIVNPRLGPYEALETLPEWEIVR